MKKIAFFFFLLLFCTVNSGCTVLSLYPIYTEDNIIFEPGLLGTWTYGDDMDKYTLEFTRPDENKNAYLLAYTHFEIPFGNTTVSYFEAHLADIGGYTILDLYPSEYDPISDPKNKVAPAFVVQTHFFLMVDLHHSFLILRIMDSGWFDEYLKANPDDIEYVDIPYGSDILLTTPTTKLQEFIINHIGVDEIFTLYAVYRRVDGAVETTEEENPPIAE
jgi:hypothetical protein